MLLLLAHQVCSGYAYQTRASANVHRVHGVPLPHSDLERHHGGSCTRRCRLAIDMLFTEYMVITKSHLTNPPHGGLRARHLPGLKHPVVAALFFVCVVHLR